MNSYEPPKKAVPQNARNARPKQPAARPSATRQRPTSRRHVGSIDGIRTLAIAAVVLYHLGVPWLRSGHMGVVIFLVLTGYLVTSSLLRRVGRGGIEAIPTFWSHRLKRIWPAMGAMVLVVTVACALFNHVLLTKMKPDFVPSLLLSTNVASILRGASYFDQIGGPSPLTHLWYLGLDAQFCLVWPAMMLFLTHDAKTGRTGRIVSLVLALASAVAMAVLFVPGQDPSRVYYGPDTRAFSPLIGAALAFWWPLGRERRPLLGGRLAPTDAQIEIAGAVSLVAILAVMFAVPATSPFLYRGGMLLVSLLSAALIASALVPGGFLARLLSSRPLGWIGSRSYGIYLWHFPLIQFFATQGSISLFPQGILAVLLSVVLAEVSHQLVERPLSRGVLPRIALVAAEVLGANGKRSLRVIAPAAACLVVALTAAVGVAAVPDEYLAPPEAITSTGDSADHAKEVEGPVADAEDETSESADEPEVDLDNLPTGKIVLRESAEQIKKGVYSPVMIGDSVPGDANDLFKEYCPTGLLDSYVGRRPDQMAAVLNDYLSQGIVGDVVILEAFSNVQATDSAIKSMIEACGDRSVFLVSTHIPQSVGIEINAQLKRIAALYDNVSIIDWYPVAAANPSYLYPDQTHLTPNGKEPYISLIANSIARTFAEKGGRVLTREENESDSKIDDAIDAATTTIVDGITDVVGNLARNSAQPRA